MLREKSKFEHKEWSGKTTKSRKKWKTKVGTKNKGKYNTVTMLVDIKPAMSTITLYVNGLNAPIKRKRFSYCIISLKGGI